MQLTYKGIACWKNGQILKVYPDFDSIAREGYDKSIIQDVCDGKKTLAKDSELTWKYVEKVKS